MKKLNRREFLTRLGQGLLAVPFVTSLIMKPKPAESFNLGELTEPIGFTHEPKFEDMDTSNVLQPAGAVHHNIGISGITLTAYDPIEQVLVSEELQPNWQETLEFEFKPSPVERGDRIKNIYFA